MIFILGKIYIYRFLLNIYTKDSLYNLYTAVSPWSKRLTALHRGWILPVLEPEFQAYRLDGLKAASLDIKILVYPQLTVIL